ncbi:hypothetical protein ABFV80_002066 [Vandammella animalimorsus]|uniref:hypothetical protein n=1 Tax=Vandammella animalimorsus TaxID=2029117 RepID=UPI00325AB84B
MEQAINALLYLREEMGNDRQQLLQALRHETHTLRQESNRFRQDVQHIVDGAGAGIKQAAEQSLQPVSKDYRDNVAALARHVGKANTMVMTWLAAGVTVLLLGVLVLWGVLTYYRREAAAEQAKLQNYENATQVLEAYNASDATVCGGLLCVKPGNRHGDYRQAKPRETQK